MSLRPRVSIFVQARMGSTRLPGKVLKTVLGRPLLAYQMERLHCVRHADDIIVATTTSAADQAIVDTCRDFDWPYFRGSEEDVLDRFYRAARHFKSHIIVRVTADCPLIDPEVIEEVIQRFTTSNDFDYVSNTIERTFPRGLDVEVFSFAALEKAYLEAKHPHEREHVTPYIYRHPEKFKLTQVTLEEDLSDCRWTIDTEEDFLMVENVIKNLYPHIPGFAMRDIFSYLIENPDVVALNAHIEQKEPSTPGTSLSYEERILALLN